MTTEPSPTVCMQHLPGVFGQYAGTSSKAERTSGLERLTTRAAETSGLSVRKLSGDPRPADRQRPPAELTSSQGSSVTATSPFLFVSSFFKVFGVRLLLSFYIRPVGVRRSRGWLVFCCASLIGISNVGKSKCWGGADFSHVSIASVALSLGTSSEICFAVYLTLLSPGAGHH